MKFQNPYSLRLFVILSFLILLAQSLLSQPINPQQQVKEISPEDSTYIAKHLEAVADNPEGLSFNLRLKDTKKQFRQGEIIWVEMAIASHKPHLYRMRAFQRTCLESLRATEMFHVLPDGASDPLYEYYNAHPPNFGCNGGRAVSELVESPKIINYRLNEWLRFDKPGKYKLYLTLPQIHRFPTKETIAENVSSLKTTSSIIEFEILPASEKWAKQELLRAVTVLDDSSQVSKHDEAAAVLRYLDTEDAIKEMIKRFGEYDFSLGLAGSSKREFMIAEMEQRIALPEQVVSTNYLDLLTRLSYGIRFPNNRIVALPQSEQERITLEEQAEKHSNNYNQLRIHYTELLAGAITQKKGVARAVGIESLVYAGTNFYNSRANPSQTASWLAKIVVEVPAIFEELPLNLQHSMLMVGWDRIASPAMLPVLKRVYEKDDDVYGHNTHGFLLRRIYELSPTEGRKMFVEEIRKGTEIKLSALSLLPDETLPEIDDVLATHLEKQSTDMFITAELVQRYATSAIAARVRAVYGDKGGKWACSIQAALLAYFLRVDTVMGSSLVKEALISRDQTGCYKSLLQDIAKLHFNADLEQIARNSLADENPEVVASAITTLGKYGSAEIEKILWQRFEMWHQQWVAKANELNTNDFSDESIRQQKQIESSFCNGLSSSPTWLADSKRLTQIVSLCITQNCKMEAKGYAARWKPEIELDYSPESDKWGSVLLAQYNLESLDQLKKKILQFPPSTTFKWIGDPSAHKKLQTVYVEMKSFIEKNGMQLIR